MPTRVDFLYMLVFTASCLIKAALHLGFISTCIRTVLPPGAWRYSLVPPAVAAGAVALFLGHNRTFATGFIALMNSGAPMLAMTLLLPAIAAGLVKAAGRQQL